MVRNRNSYLGAPDGFKVLGILNVSCFGLETEVISIPVAGTSLNRRGYFLQQIGYLLGRPHGRRAPVGLQFGVTWLLEGHVLLLDIIKAFLGYSLTTCGVIVLPALSAGYLEYILSVRACQALRS